MSWRSCTILTSTLKKVGAKVHIRGRSRIGRGFQIKLRRGKNMAKVIALSNQKGVSGRRPLHIISELSLESRGCRVLLVDFDSQGNLTGMA